MPQQPTVLFKADGMEFNTDICVTSVRGGKKVSQSQPMESEPEPASPTCQPKNTTQDDTEPKTINSTKKTTKVVITFGGRPGRESPEICYLDLPDYSPSYSNSSSHSTETYSQTTTTSNTTSYHNQPTPSHQNAIPYYNQPHTGTSASHSTNTQSQIMAPPTTARYEIATQNQQLFPYYNHQPYTGTSFSQTTHSQTMPPPTTGYHNLPPTSYHNSYHFPTQSYQQAFPYYNYQPHPTLSHTMAPPTSYHNLPTTPHQFPYYNYQPYTGSIAKSKKTELKRVQYTLHQLGPDDFRRPGNTRTVKAAPGNTISAVNFVQVPNTKKKWFETELNRTFTTCKIPSAQWPLRRIFQTKGCFCVN